MATGYAELLRTRHAARLLGGTLVGRLPNATAALAVVLFARDAGAGYPLAGSLSAVYGVCTAIGQPLLGRAVDHYGQPRVMLPASVVSALGMTLFAFVGLDPLWLAYAALAVAGFFTPPLEGGLRALWPGVLRRPDRVHAAYALDAVAQEVMFAAGPSLVTLFGAFWSPGGALLVINAVGVLGALSVVVSPPSRRWRSEPRDAHWLGALRSAGMLVVLGTFFFVGLALGGMEVSAVAYAEERGGGMISSLLLSALGAGALVGGLVYGAREWPGRPESRLRLLIGLLALGYLPLALTPGVAGMAALTGCAGVFLAPSLACAFVVVDRHAPKGTVTEAFSWIVTTFLVGAAVGSSVVGPAVQGGGPAAGFAVSGAGGVTALLVLLSTKRFLGDPVKGGAGALPAENDRNGAVEPGFRAGRQA
ncbi:MFS transporter [Streptomyces sp. NPDC001339]|uniref:MFS transporter n=1 Tax=Streptomyces sp. NPDC001339 TaxID=3364563 RepID=UPI003681850A